MAADERDDRAGTEGRYRRLPESVHLEDTIASVDPHPILDADAVRNGDQDRALGAGG